MNLNPGNQHSTQAVNACVSIHAHQEIFSVTEPSQVGEVRRHAKRLAGRLGFGENDTERVGIMITEAATNLVRYASSGMVIMGVANATADPGIEFYVLDRKPGMKNIDSNLRDGTTTGNSLGIGLGAMQRLSTEFELYSFPGSGTAVLMRFFPHSRSVSHSRPDFGAINVPFEGQQVSGDVWYLRDSRARTRVMVADVLGHGVNTQNDVQIISSVVLESGWKQPVELIELLHQALRGYRGAAVAVAEINYSERKLRFAGVGNIAATILSNGASQGLVSRHGTVGHQMRSVRQFTVPFHGDQVLIMHSDGLKQRWKIDDYPGLIWKHPALIAGVLFRDYRRKSDDSTVLALRNRDLGGSTGSGHDRPGAE